MPQTAAEQVTQGDKPEALIQTSNFRSSRPQVVGPDKPELPFPIVLQGKVEKGFGRGSKDLGCPTANLPDESILPISTVAKSGVYYGFAQVVPKDGEELGLGLEDFRVWPMVMSLGWNPFYKNEKLTAEIHIMHQFNSDFYGLEMRALVLGYIRPELDYVSREALIADIDMDKTVALNSLKRAEYQRFSQDHCFNLESSQVKL